MFSCLFQKYLKQMKTLTQIKLDDRILGVNTQSFNWKYRLFFYICALFSKSTHIFTNFTIGTIGNKTGDILKSVKPCVSSLQM